MSRGVVALGLAAVVVEAGCMVIWALSPQLTAIYNAEFSAQFFARVPALAGLADYSRRLLGPLGEVGPDALSMTVHLVAGLSLMIAGYIGALLALVLDSPARRAATWIVVGCSVAFRLTLVLLPGLFSTDIFSYVMYGRIAAVYGANPYLRVPNDFASDPFVAWVFPFWRDQPSVYGPAWTDFTWLLSLVTAGLDTFGQVVAYRFALMAFDAATLGLLWWLLGRVRPDTGCSFWRTFPFAMFAWNPLVLFDLTANAHNDTPMLALLLLGLVPIAGRSDVSDGRWLTGITSMILGALVKYASGVVALMSITTWVAQAAAWRGRILRLGLIAGVTGSLALVLWSPWLDATQALAPIGDAATGKLVLNSAPDVVALTLADRILTPAGIDSSTAQADARFWVRTFARVTFVVYLAWEVWRLWRTARGGGRQAVQATIRASTRALLLLPLLVLTWVWSWYFSWSLALAAFLGWTSALARLVVVYTLVVLPIVYAHQYLNEELPGGFVVALALVPPAIVLVGQLIRRRLLVPGGAHPPLTLRG